MNIAEYLEKLNNTKAIPGGQNGKDFAEAMLNAVDIWSNGACKGYAAAAAIGAGLTPEQTESLLDNLEAAFDNMTVDEAEHLYQSDEWRPQP